MTFEDANAIDKIVHLESLPLDFLFPIGWGIICIIVVVGMRNKDNIKIRNK